jgi:hypothetical protein
MTADATFRYTPGQNAGFEGRQNAGRFAQRAHVRAKGPQWDPGVVE